MKKQINKTSGLENIQMLAGLGNPGETYAHTYHNAGLLALTHLCDFPPHGWVCSGVHTPRNSFSYRTLTGPQKKTLLCIFPHTFMNESGRAIHDALLFFKLPVTSILVLHDDSDMTTGTYKITFDQRSAGHKGIASIIQQCASQEFYRCKIGIRPLEEIRRKKADEFVLKRISKKDMDVFEKNIFSHIISDILG